MFILLASSGNQLPVVHADKIQVRQRRIEEQRKSSPSSSQCCSKRKSLKAFLQPRCRKSRDRTISQTSSTSSMASSVWFEVLRQVLGQLICIAVWLLGLLMLFQPKKFLPECNEGNTEGLDSDYPGCGTLMICGSALIFLSMGALLYLVRKNDRPLETS